MDLFHLDLFHLELKKTKTKNAYKTIKNQTLENLKHRYQMQN